MEELRAQVVRRIEAMSGGWCTASRLSGVDRVTLYRAFKVKGRKPTLKTLLKIAPVIGVKVALLEK
jgi:DNA-binding phage protein